LIYFFENYSLDVDRRELHRGVEAVAVEPQVFDVLAYLIGHRERVISNNDLIASVWNGRIVSESTLSSRIAAVRHAVGDSGERQRLIRTIPRKGYRFIGEVRENTEAGGGLDATPKNAVGLTSRMISAHLKQAVTFCQTADGVNIAVASVGCGPVLVQAARWATHIEYDWQNLVTGPLLRRLADRFHLVRYDGRGTGLSDRDVPAISFQTMLYDLEAVVDALPLERFALLGISGGAATSIAYAVRHPHRVSKLVLFGGYAQGRNKRDSPQDAEEAQAFLTLARHGWGDDRSGRSTISTLSTCCPRSRCPRSSFTASATGLFRSTRAGVWLPPSRMPGLCRSTARTTRCLRTSLRGRSSWRKWRLFCRMRVEPLRTLSGRTTD
jgi:DNA-binding winged helix-turn-helix (wHTH) protein/pimeloyl-ACP methyl ester carboxylesterase